MFYIMQLSHWTADKEA